MSKEVNHPPHYTQGEVECIQAMESNSTPEHFQEHCRLTAQKYLWRCRYKGKFRQDVEKAIWYLQRLLKSVDNAPTSNGNLKISAIDRERGIITGPLANNYVTAWTETVHMGTWYSAEKEEKTGGECSWTDCKLCQELYD
jgi:hypothetical protein